MRIDLYITHESDDPVAHDLHTLHMHSLFRSLNTKVDTIMATQAEHAAKLRALGTQLAKARTEIISAVDKLKAAIEAGGNSSEEVDDATAALETAVQGLDDLNPDEASPVTA
ncbi:MAG TPA: hypothetical protein VK524_18415 [Polyangiaceae bacterium]|nr:hypothetical protein [Polyangiaceae bacterium]